MSSDPIKALVDTMAVDRIDRVECRLIRLSALAKAMTLELDAIADELRDALANWRANQTK